jgi:hypothetical protein
VKPVLLALTLVLLPGCLVMRVGGGMSYRGDTARQPGSYDAEVGLIVPVPDEHDGPSWVVSPLAIVRTPTSEGGWTALGLELARRLGTPARPNEPRGSCLGGDVLAGTYLGGRVEAGRDDVGRYVGGAVVVRRLFLEDLCPLFPSASLLLNAGAYVGPVHGPVIGLHLLLGFN